MHRTTTLRAFARGTASPIRVTLCDLAFALDQSADWIALSFVQRPEDVAEARKLMGGSNTALMAKIEKPAAIDRLAEIIELADGIMVARGDLGVELNPEEVPPLQKRIVAATRRSGKPVVVATQMLESMIESPAPTRAEVSDVANAVYDGADAVMLSAETASGAWPVEAVTIMHRIAGQVESDPGYHDRVHFTEVRPDATTADGAIDGADDRDFEQSQHLHRFMHRVQQLLQDLRQRARRIGKDGDVAAGAELAASGCDQQRAHRLVAGNRGDGSSEGLRQCQVEHVRAFGVIESDDGQPGVDLELQR